MTERSEIAAIRELVHQARRRMRVQAVMEGATTAFIAATAMVVIVIVLVRTGAVGSAVGLWLAIAAAALVPLGAALGLIGSEDDETIARRIDRASGTSDRLSSAIAFEPALAGTEPDADFKCAAIRDAVRFVDRARIELATPYRIPRDARFAAGFLALAALIAGIALPAPETDEAVVGGSEHVVLLDDDDHAGGWDIGFPSSLTGGLRKLATRDHNEPLLGLAAELDAQLARLARDEIDKLELLASFDQAEAVARGAAGELSDDAGAQLGDLREALRRLRRLDRVALRTPHKPPVAESPPTETPRSPSGPKPDPRPGMSSDLRMPKTPDRGTGAGESKQYGNGPGPELAGEPHDTPRKTRDELLHGERGDGSSTRATIQTAAQRGFASQPYVKVYAEYEKTLEEVMRNEKLPSSYRYYIKKYFHAIRPKS